MVDISARARRGQPLNQIHLNAGAAKQWQEHRYIRPVLVRMGQGLQHTFQQADRKAKPGH